MPPRHTVVTACVLAVLALPLLILDRIPTASALPISLLRADKGDDAPLPGTGLTLEPCRTDEDCQGDRICFDFNSLNPILPVKACGVSIIQVNNCKSCKDCANYPAEVCLTSPNAFGSHCGGVAAFLIKGVVLDGCPDFTMPTPEPTIEAQPLKKDPRKRGNGDSPRRPGDPNPPLVGPSTPDVEESSEGGGDDTVMEASTSPMPSEEPPVEPSATPAAAPSPAVVSVATPPAESETTPDAPVPIDIETGVESTPVAVSPSVDAAPPLEPAGPETTAPDNSDGNGSDDPSDRPGGASEGLGNDDDDSPSPTDEESEICIAVHHLQKLTRDDLVYHEHRRAVVLCDVSRNCATPGHVVLFRGDALLMRSYCARVEGGCERAVMHVNSPRFARRRTVQSHVDALVFTALAARFETSFEERLLQGAVRFLGL